MRLRIVACALLAVGAGFAAVAVPAARAETVCGVPEAPCSAGEGTYHVALPDSSEAAPAVLWLHGFGSSGTKAVANAGFVERYTGRGYALIAPNGQPFPTTPARLDWGVNDGHDWRRDDVAFLQMVLDDAISRFKLDAARILVAGFSRGGSMAWDLACLSPQMAAGFAAVSGAFWEPMAETCTAPVHLHHTHGFSDKLVPLEGREVAFQGLEFAQGNVYKGLEIWRRRNGCLGGASEVDVKGDLWRKVWAECDAGSLTLQLSPRGHGIPKGWTAQVLDWFERLVAAQ